MLINEFINKIEGMQFFYVDDFYLKKEQIKDKYESLSYEEKSVYKWYFFYQLCFVKGKMKSLLWDYVNGKKENAEIDKEYNLYCKRRKEVSDTMRSRSLSSNIWQK